MIIKEIRIKNFRSYFGDDNRFEFSDGLTLIIGDNGDGKTTFFEALQWLFNTTIDRGSVEHISEMRKSQMDIDERDEVSVAMLFEHDGEKTVEKSFAFERTDKGFRIDKLVYRGFESNGVEREAVNGKQLIERCYDAFIQRFSMFKGESELNVFDNATALKELVDKFSDIRKFDHLVELSATLQEKASAQYLREVKSDKKIGQDVKELEAELTRVGNEITLRRRDIRDKKDSLELYTKRLDELEQNQEASERYNAIKARLATQEERRNKLRGQIAFINYSHALLDRMWILAPFLPILQEFKRKCSALSKEKRRQEKDYERQRAIEIGKLEAVKEMQGALINGATELPWYLPNQETMEEMLHDHICKVCGREAPEGSEPYAFMLHKLEDYKRHAEAKLQKDREKKLIEERELFSQTHIESLHNLSISLSGSNEAQVAGISGEIYDRLELVARLTQELKAVEQKIQDINDEKTRLLVQSNASEQMLEKNFNDVKGLFTQKEQANVRLAQLEKDLTALELKKAELNERLNQLNPENSQVKVYKEVHRILEAISDAFAYAKKENLRRFLHELEERANRYMEKLSASDFHGEIRLDQTFDDSTEIHLYSSNETEIRKPSGSQKTVMYISVLFAISDFTQEKRDEDYPLIFDAATSSFGDSKESYFYNVVAKIQKQCIIVTKDFIAKGKVNYPAISELNCSIYRIKKMDGFDQSNMATIRTLIEKIQ